MAKKKLTSNKAKEILKDGSVHGHPLTDKQKRYFGYIAGGGTPKAQNGIEGTMGGLTDKGFNYNPAWGGRWQNGGKTNKPFKIPGRFLEAMEEYNQPDYTLQYGKNKDRQWNVSTKDIKQIVATAVGMGYDPKKALAVALQESKLRQSDPSTFHAWDGNKSLPEDEKGIAMLIEKEKLANKLGYNTEEMELQTYNGLGKIFRPSGRSKFLSPGYEKVYGVDVPEGGLDLKKNPLYGKRVLDLKKNVIDNDVYVNKVVDHYKKFYNDPESVYYTRTSDLPAVEVIGKKQMGGMLPGATGFMYARTGAPSNGPYAKKTKASAKNGMSFYQNGLDWKPRNISRNGNIVNAQVGTITPPGAFGTPQGTAQLLLPAIKAVSNVLSAPQKAATFLATTGFQPGPMGKYQTPAEAMNIQHPVGSFITNMALDPMTYVGAGAFKNLYKGATSAGKAKNVKLTQKDVEKLAKVFKVEQPKPSFGKMVTDKVTAEDYLKNFNKNIKKQVEEINEVRKGAIDSYNEEVNILRRNPEEIDPGGYLRKVIDDPNYLYENALEYSLINDPKINSYLAKGYHMPAEHNLRLTQGGRGLLGERQGAFGEVSKGETPRIWGNFQNRAKPWNVFDESFFIRKNKKGGKVAQDEITVDPMGYWNPENWGKPVMIPSNEITMEGVDQPLLGISDMGDVQMMYPGGDYTFEGDNVTEYPVAQNGMGIQDRGQLKKLDQLTNFTNYNTMAKKGKSLKKAAIGSYIGGESSVFQPLNFKDVYNAYDYNLTGTTDEMRQQQQQQKAEDKKNKEEEENDKDDLSTVEGATSARNKSANRMMSGISDFAPTFLSLFEPAKRGKKVPKAQYGIEEQKIGRLMNQAKTMDQITGGLSTAGDIIGGFQQVQQAVKEKRKAKQFKELSKLAMKASATRPEIQQRKYVRPEDSLTDPGQVYPTLGVGTNYLQMQDGGQVFNQIGGNPTEIMNMYNPGTLYDNLGYEPFGESETVKRYQKGGKAQGGMELIGPAVKTLGSIVSGIIGVGTKRISRQAQQQLGQAAFQQGMTGVQGQYAPFMEDGGYLSHNWQPQVITKFGDYTMKELLRPDTQSDIKRAGGPVRDIRSNYMGNDEYMGMMKMGGNLKTYWGGDTELMSYNPYMPGSGETHMVRGQSHEESDGKGNTGVGLSYGKNMVEAERGEPIVEMEEGGNVADTSAVIYGNLKIPAYGVSELNDPNAKGKKFKHYVADLSNQEVKANKKLSKAFDMINSAKTSSPFDRLTVNSAKMMMQGSDQKLREIAQKKRTAAGVQNAILETAEEQGLDSDALAKGKIKAAKPENEAKMGKKIQKAQFGSYKDEDYTPDVPGEADYVPVQNPYLPFMGQMLKQPMVEMQAKDLPYSDVVWGLPKMEDMKTAPEKGKKKDIIGTINKILGTAMPYLRPSNQMELDPSQLTPEMASIAMNQLEPVQAQKYQPMLTQVSRIATAQPKINEINAQFNAMSRLFANNPSVQSTLSAQKYDAISKAVGEEFALNQQREDAVRAQNIATLNDATLKNLSILDQQFVRQAQAKSATKAQAIETLKSIADKIAKNKLENRTLGIYENLYNYRFGPRGVAYNMNAPASWTTPEFAVLDPEVQKQIIDMEKLRLSKKESKKESKNGSIVKAIKNL